MVFYLYFPFLCYRHIFGRRHEENGAYSQPLVRPEIPSRFFQAKSSLLPDVKSKNSFISYFFVALYHLKSLASLFHL